MKLIILIIIILLSVSGCSEPFIAGTVTGAAIEEWADGIQEDFVIAANKVAVRTKELNIELDSTKGAVIIKPETVAAYRAHKGREKDPITWIAVAESLGLAAWFGKWLKGRETL